MGRLTSCKGIFGKSLVPMAAISMRLGFDVCRPFAIMTNALNAVFGFYPGEML
ncbi:hypothetical protein ES703_20386 [subsurface metagenome]